MAARHGEILRDAAVLIEAGKLIPHLDSRMFDLDQVEAAHAAVADGSAVGKVVVSVMATGSRA